MAQMNIIQALNNALKTEMRLNDKIVVLGEDVGRLGGVFRVTVGLIDEFGTDRVIDTPLAEAGIIGSALGMALYGLRPVAEIQFADFIFPAFDQIVNEVAKYRYRSGGQYSCPMVIRTPYGGGIKGGHYHSQSPEAYFAHTAGLKIVIPSNPYDAKGLLIAAIRDNDPVIFFEPKRIYRASSGEVPDNDYVIPIGKANIVRKGKDVVLLAYGAMVPVAMSTAEKAAQEGIEIELIDIRTLVPLDVETIIESVKRIGKVIVVHEAPKTCGFGAELVAVINEHAFLYLEAPVMRVTGFDTPFPYSLEKYYLPDENRILYSVREVMSY